MANKSKVDSFDVDSPSNIRCRFTVPPDDVLVNEWIARQSNLGFSLRVLIKAYIAMLGMTDASCTMNVVVPKRGRPPKDAQDRLKKAFEAVNDTDISLASDSVDALDVYEKQPILQDTIQPVAQQAQPTQQAPRQASSQGTVDIMAMMGPQTTMTKSAMTNSDDDGFIDPDDIL